MNLSYYRETSIRTVFEAVKKQASQWGVTIMESELIGLIPEEALKEISAEELQLTHFCTDCIIETYL